MTHDIRLRSGRVLEVWEYGDPGGHPTLFFHGLIGFAPWSPRTGATWRKPG